MLNLSLLINLIKFQVQHFKDLKKEELATTTDPNTIKHFATKNKEKIKKIQTFDSSFFKGNLMMVFKIRLFINRHLVNWV